MSMQDLLARADRVFMKNVGRLPLVLARGEGSRLWDVDGKEYIDFLTGVSVDSLGHCHPAITAAVQKQAERLVHVSNYFLMEDKIVAAERLLKLAGMDRIFWSNSGTEANEAALKLARKYGKPQGKYRFVSALNSFHGRTMGSLSLTGQPKYQENFRPLP
ncbi:MAG TPA: aminotransferase class III-fold pyridoxal phosphate-dependent enzyme, partial [Bacillota bacterium]|nr:aminotransferase class III-fold pyridoxal phosphate-dependent enzyme [Bacillota bacterium]